MALPVARFWKILVWTISGISLVAYPLLVWFGWTRLEPRALGCALLVALGIRFLAFGTRGRSLAPAAMIPLVPVAVGVVLGDENLFLWYPVFISGATGIWFWTTLRRIPAIEGFARLRHQDLSPHAVRHCRRATVAWTVFLWMNTAVAAASASWGNLRFWTIWNGGISYALMGLMFATEFAIRPRQESVK